MDYIRNILNGEFGVVNVQYCTIVRFVDFKYEVIIVRDDQSVSVAGILGNGVIVRPFSEFGGEVHVFDIVAVVFESMKDLMFDVFVENKAIHHPSVFGRRQRGSLLRFLTSSFVSLLDSLHLLWIVVVVCERFVDISNV